MASDLRCGIMQPYFLLNYQWNKSLAYRNRLMDVEVMSLPSYQIFMQPVLKALANGKTKTVRQITQEVSDEFHFTTEQRALLNPSGTQKVIDGRIGWAKTYLVQANLMEQPKRGQCVITARGKAALDSGEVIDNRYLRQFDEFKSFLSRSNNDGTKRSIEESNNIDSENQQTPIEILDNTFNTLNSALANDIMRTILSASPELFEKLVVELMLAMGYGGSRKDAGQATQYTQDGGIDGIIKEDKLGLEMIYLQAKRYSNRSVGRPEIQAFAGALDMHRAKKGVFITTSTFTREAREFTTIIEKRIVLIDGDMLTDLMISHNLGVTIKQVYEVKTLDSDYFLED